MTTLTTDLPYALHRPNERFSRSIREDACQDAPNGERQHEAPPSDFRLPKLRIHDPPWDPRRKSGAMAGAAVPDHDAGDGRYIPKGESISSRTKHTQCNAHILGLCCVAKSVFKAFKLECSRAMM